VNYKVGTVYDGLEDEFEYFDDIPSAQSEAAELMAKWRLGEYVQDVFIEECYRLPGPPEDMIKTHMAKIVAVKEAKRKREEERRVHEDLGDLTYKAQSIANRTGQAVLIQVNPQVIKQE